MRKDKLVDKQVMPIKEWIEITGIGDQSPGAFGGWAGGAYVSVAVVSFWRKFKQNTNI